MKARPLRHVILRISNRKGAHRQSSGRAEVAHQRFWVVCICSASAQGAQAAAHPQDQLGAVKRGRYVATSTVFAAYGYRLSWVGGWHIE